MISKSTESPRRQGVPLRPAWDEYQRPPFVARAMVVAGKYCLDPAQFQSAENAAKALWPGDQVTPLLTRAASSPASTTNTAALTHSAVGEFLQSLAPLSAAASLFSAAPRIELGRLSSITFPRRSAAIDASAVAWIDESSPARVPQLNITGGAQLGPVKKLLAIAAASRELVEASDAESAIKILLRKSAAFSLDVSVFSAIAGSSARPAGLLSGVSALTPAAATAGKDAAMDDDLAALAGAVGAVAAGLAFVMHPQQANAVRTRRGTQWDPTIPIWPTIGVAAGNVIALDPAGVASAFGPEAEVRASREAAIVFDNSAPGAINVAGSSPAGSIFQTDSIVLQLRLRAAWCLRIPGAVAWMSGVNW